MNVPFEKRQYRAFLSYSYKDKAFVELLYDWLERVARIPIWHDEHRLAVSSMIATDLADTIVQCQSFIIVLSKASVASGWVKEEYNLAIAQRVQFPEFHIIPIVIDDCEIPGFLNTTKYIKVSEGKIDLELVYDILSSFHYDYKALLMRLQKALDVYVSCSWRPQETAITSSVCRVLDKAGFGLIGDSITQSKYKDDRIDDIISSCGGLVAILPNRGSDKSQYQYMLQEIKIAQSLQLPCLIIAASEINVPEVEDIQNKPLTYSVRIDSKNLESSEFVEAHLLTEIDALKQRWVPPSPERYVFLATDLETRFQKRSHIISNMVQEVTGMQCKMGDALIEGQIQFVIRNRIIESFMTIADVSENNVNTCIEAGVALAQEEGCVWLRMENLIEFLSC